MKYRKEIDGLRAVAVVPVILFHAGFSWLSGGYVGVDVFFVISGFLITTIIIAEKAANSFSILKFYERRARRILPALFTVLFASTLAACVLMPAALLKAYSQSLVSVVLFSSNIYFYLTAGYFSVASEEKPLLHTWSLAVEEQYYVIFPLLVISLWPFGRRILVFAIGLLAAASFGWAQYQANTKQIDANFYLIFGRAWELFFGSAAAFLLAKQFHVGRIWREAMSAIGLALILFAVLCFDRSTPFPSFYTLLPVIGTTLIIVFADGTTLVGKGLAHRSLVGIGLASYSLYLWHQPIFAFVRVKTIGEPTLTTMLYAIVATCALATLSLKYIEAPFRNRSRITQAQIFRFATVASILFVGVGMTGHFARGLEGRFQGPGFSDSIQHSPKRNECHTQGESYLKPERACTYAGKKVTWAVLGDSHVVEPAFALADRIQPKGEGLIHLSFSTCAPALNFEVRNPGCSRWINEALAHLERSPNVKKVLIGFRYSSFLFGDQLKSYPALPSVSPNVNFTPALAGVAPDKIRELYWTGLRELISRLTTSGKTVYVMYPVPELPADISKLVVPFSVFDSGPDLQLDSVSTYAYYLNRNSFILEKLDSLPYSEKLVAIKPASTICNALNCAAVRDGKALYFDDNHLSLSGAFLVIDSIFRN